MSIIYNRTYKVPVWVVVDVAGGTGDEIVRVFQDADAHKVSWPSKTFPITVADLGQHGWGNHVNKPYPIHMALDFLVYAAMQHMKPYGSKTFCGSPVQPYNTLNRKVESADDYVRLFDDFLAMEPDTSLSYIFDVGKLCHQDAQKTRVFVTRGPAPTKVLQRIADRVITVGGEGSDVVVGDREVNDVTAEAIQKAAEILGINK